MMSDSIVYDMYAICVRCMEYVIGYGGWYVYN